MSRALHGKKIYSAEQKFTYSIISCYKNSVPACRSNDSRSIVQPILCPEDISATVNPVDDWKLHLSLQSLGWDVKIEEQAIFRGRSTTHELTKIETTS
jgi:hypothetical protein